MPLDAGTLLLYYLDATDEHYRATGVLPRESAAWRRFDYVIKIITRSRGLLERAPRWGDVPNAMSRIVCSLNTDD
jgi:hypothetical protein